MSATFISGNGGYIEVKVGAGAFVRLDIHKWTLRKTSRLTENTHSGTPASNFEHVIPHYEWTAEVPIDTANFPDGALGLVEGAKVTINFYLGSSTKKNVLAGTSVESLEDVDDNAEDIVRTTVTGKGGALTRAT